MAVGWRNPERASRDVRFPSGAGPQAAAVARRREIRRWLAVAAYGLLLALTFATITDRRLLWFSVTVLLVLLALTLFRAEAEGVPAPWNRAADGVSSPVANGSPESPPKTET